MRSTHQAIVITVKIGIGGRDGLPGRAAGGNVAPIRILRQPLVSKLYRALDAAAGVADEDVELGRYQLAEQVDRLVL